MTAHTSRPSPTAGRVPAARPSRRHARLVAAAAFALLAPVAAPDAHAQATGTTVDVDGTYYFCLPDPDTVAPICDPTGASVDADTLGPPTASYPAGLPFGQLLGAAGFSGPSVAVASSEPVAACGDGTFPAQTGTGGAWATDAYSGEWSTRAQVSADCDVPYDVTMNARTGDPGGVDGWNRYFFAPGEVTVTPDASGTVDGGVFAETPALLRVCYRVADYDETGAPIANPDYRTYFSDDLECPCGGTPALLLQGVASNGADVAVRAIDAAPGGGDAVKAHGKLLPGYHRDIVIEGGHRYSFTSSTVAVQHPAFGPMNMLVASGRAGGGDTVYVDVDNDHPAGFGGFTDASGAALDDPDDVIAPLGVASACVPLAGTNRGCALGRASVAGLPVYAYTVTMEGGSPAVNATRSEFGAFDPQTGGVLTAAPTDWLMPSVFPKLYQQMSVDFRIIQEAVTSSGQPAGWSPRSATAWAMAPRSLGRVLDASNNVESTGYDTRPGGPLPAGPSIPDQCMRQDLDAFTAYEDLVPAWVSGHVRLYDGGTTLVDGSQRLLDTVVYSLDRHCYDPAATNCGAPNPHWTHVTSQGSGFGGTGLSSLDHQAPSSAETHSEALPPRDPNTNRPYIDPTLDRTEGFYRHPVLGLNVRDPATGLIKKHRWLTQTLRMRLGYSVHTAERFVLAQHVAISKRRPHPSYPTGFDAAGAPQRRLGIPAGPFLQPGVAGQDTDANNNFDVCLGLIRVQINETGIDPNTGQRRRFYSPSATAHGVGFLLGDPDPIPNADDPLGLDQGLTPQPSASQLGGHTVAGTWSGWPQATAATAASRASSTGYINMPVPAGHYTLSLRYSLLGGGTTTIPPITATVRCGETLELTPELTVDVDAAACTLDGAAEVTGRARVTNATVADISYVARDSAEVVVDAGTLAAPAGGWGNDAPFAFSLDLPAQCERYSVEVTATASDDTTATRTTFVVYQDSELPTITYTPTGATCEELGPFVLQTTTIGGAGVPNDLPFSFSATDNCDPGFIPVALVSGDIAPNVGTLPVGGPYAISATTGDACGNQQRCDFTVQVLDRDCRSDATPPQVTAGGAITVTDADADGRELVDFAGHAVAADPDYASPAVTVTYDPPSGSAFPVGTTTVRASATNECGLTGVATFDVVVEPAPLFIACPDDVTLEATPGTCAADAVELGVPEYAGGVVTHDGPDAFGPGTTEVTWTVTSEQGATATCVQRVTVAEDAAPPVITACALAEAVVSASSSCAFAAPDLTAELDVFECSGIASVTQDPAPGTLLGPGEHHFTFTVTDETGLTATCSTSSGGGPLTVLPRLHVVFQQPPLRDDNVMDDIETDDDYLNRFKVGSHIPVKARLLACEDGADLTGELTGQVTLRLGVTLRQEIGDAVAAVDVPEEYSGVGDAGGVMVPTGNHFQYNLDTSNGFYPTGTVGDASRWFRAHVTATWDTDPDVVVGEEDATLESK